MNFFYGTLMAVIGLFLVICGAIRSNFVIYRLLVARGCLLWGKGVHRFHELSGLILLVLSILWATGVI